MYRIVEKEAIDTANICHVKVEILSRHNETVTVIKKKSKAEVRIILITCEGRGEVTLTQPDDDHQTKFEQH